MFSSVDNCLDGHTYVESDLTTPESMDAFRMMREAADNGMEYLVMEVYGSRGRVTSPLRWRITCIANAKSLVLGADSLHADLLREDAAAAGIGATTFALHDADNAGTSADVVAWPADTAHASFHIADGDQTVPQHLP